MSENPKYRVDPGRFDLPPEVGDLIHQIYVVEQKSMDDAVRIAKMRTGLKFSPENGRRFIRANGWKRSPRFYAKRSPWQGHARLALEEHKARDRMNGND